jgi:serine/threonine protein kinase
MAVKNANVPEDTSKDEGIWFNYPFYTIPSEVVAMRTLNKQPTSPYIAGFKGYRVLKNQTAYRIIMPAAEFGDCAHFLENWVRDSTPECRYMTSPKLFPGAFLMDILAACMKAGDFMAKRNMLRNDIKLHNILLAQDSDATLKEFASDGDGNANGWGIKPLFADFGWAKSIESKRFRYPKDLLWYGTPGMRPPEQVQPSGRCGRSIVERLEGHPVHIGEKAMVFSIAASIFMVSLCCRARWASSMHC